MVAIAVGGGRDYLVGGEGGLDRVSRVAAVNGVLEGGDVVVAVGRVLGVVDVGVQDASLLVALLLGQLRCVVLGLKLGLFGGF